MNIIILHESDIYAEFLTKALEMKGHKVIGAYDHCDKTMISVLSRSDVVIIDLDATYADMYFCAKIINFENSSAKLLAISNDPSKINLESLIVTGFKGYVRKCELGKYIHELLTTIENGGYDFKEMKYFF